MGMRMRMRMEMNVIVLCHALIVLCHALCMHMRMDMSFLRLMCINLPGAASGVRSL